MSAANSPYYAYGRSDGARDADEVRAGREPLGMDGGRSWSGMYRDGYRDGLADDDTDSTGPGDVVTVDVIEVDMSPFAA